MVTARRINHTADGVLEENLTTCVASHVGEEGPQVLATYLFEETLLG
jgi:hypothetical protein